MRRHAAGVVTAVDALDLDDFGAKIGEHHGRGGPGYDGAEVQNAYACQWRGQRVEDSTDLVTGATPERVRRRSSDGLFEPPTLHW